MGFIFCGYVIYLKKAFIILSIGVNDGIFFNEAGLF